ncbi:MAG: 30S ribosomal protein S20 [Endozoicomonadaceae bacterium]|nr:30S ribosomal protein S20 [Endozoicomonadaceae bacterium]
MANTASSKKRARQALVRRNLNISQKSLVRTMIKKVIASIESKNIEKAKAAYQQAVPVIDRMADKQIIHKNKAARYKSRLNKKIKDLCKK